jgi:hypothetical protein
VTDLFTWNMVNSEHSFQEYWSGFPVDAVRKHIDPSWEDDFMLYVCNYFTCLCSKVIFGAQRLLKKLKLILFDMILASLFASNFHTGSLTTLMKKSTNIEHLYLIYWRWSRNIPLLYTWEREMYNQHMNIWFLPMISISMLLPKVL